MNQALTIFPQLTTSTTGSAEDTFRAVRTGEKLIELDIRNPKTHPNEDNPGAKNEDGRSSDFTEALIFITNSDTQKKLAPANSSLISTKQMPGTMEQLLAIQTNTEYKIKNITIPALEQTNAADALKKIAEQQKVPAQGTTPSSIVALGESAISADPKLLASIPDKNATKIPLATIPATGQDSLPIIMSANPQLNNTPTVNNIPPAINTNSTNVLTPISPPETLANNVPSKTNNANNSEIITTQQAPLATTDKLFLPQGNLQQSPSQGNAIITQLGATLTEQATEIISQLRGKSDNSPRPILVQLSPAELGRVQIQFRFDGHEKIVANIIAENAETGTLLKQKSDMLIAHLRIGGFENIDLNFESKTEKNFSDFVSDDSKNNAAAFSLPNHNADNPPENTKPENPNDWHSHDKAERHNQNVVQIKRPMSHLQTGQLDITV